jgi:hypothetical protein
MPGKNKPKRIPIWQHPFILVKITACDQERHPVFAKPIWLIMVGQRREPLSLEQIFQAYHSRSHLEHFFRFGKQQLLLTDSQTPVTAREERWWHLVHIAYAMLWMARHLANHLPRPWEQYLPKSRCREMTPTLVLEMRSDFSRSWAHRRNRPNPEESHRDANRAQKCPLGPAIRSSSKVQNSPNRLDVGLFFQF